MDDFLKKHCRVIVETMIYNKSCNLSYYQLRKFLFSTEQEIWDIVNMERDPLTASDIQFYNTMSDIRQLYDITWDNSWVGYLSINDLVAYYIKDDWVRSFIWNHFGIDNSLKTANTLKYLELTLQLLGINSTLGLHSSILLTVNPDTFFKEMTINSVLARYIDFHDYDDTKTLHENYYLLNLIFCNSDIMNVPRQLRTPPMEKFLRIIKEHTFIDMEKLAYIEKNLDHSPLLTYNHIKDLIYEKLNG